MYVYICRTQWKNCTRIKQLNHQLHVELTTDWCFTTSFDAGWRDYGFWHHLLGKRQARMNNNRKHVHSGKKCDLKESMHLMKKINLISFCSFRSFRMCSVCIMIFSHPANCTAWTVDCWQLFGLSQVFPKTCKKMWPTCRPIFFLDCCTLYLLLHSRCLNLRFPGLANSRGFFVEWAKWFEAWQVRYSLRWMSGQWPNDFLRKVNTHQLLKSHFFFQ